MKSGKVQVDGIHQVQSEVGIWEITSGMEMKDWVCGAAIAE